MINPETRDVKIRKILVPLDASPHSMAALEVAVKFARNLQAELQGLFVEDTDLLKLGDFPFVQEVCLYSQQCKPLDKNNLERQLRARATNVRSKLAELSSLYDVPWSFQVSRGGVSSEILEASFQVDLTILGKIGWSLSGGAKLGSTVEQILRKGSGPTFILQQGVRLKDPVIVLFTGSQLSWNSLSIAAKIKKITLDPLVVLLPAASGQEYRELSQKVLAYLRAQNIKEPMCRHLEKPYIQDLYQNISSSGPIVLPDETIEQLETSLKEILSRFDNPVLLVKNKE